VLAGDPVVMPLLGALVPQEMAAMVETMKMDIHASDSDVLSATLAKLQEEDVKTSAEKVERLLAQYRTWGLAVVGPEETLEAMLAPEIPDAEGGTKSLEPRQASLPICS
jgi:hypothetical protein